MAGEKGVDRSHWQSKADKTQCQKMWNMGVRFIVNKCSQGTGYKDDCFDYNTKLFQDFGFKTTAYHFVTTANAIQQYNWFMECMGDFKPDIAVWLDCEAYTGNKLGIPAIYDGKELEVLPIRPVEYCYCSERLYKEYRYGIGYTAMPTEAIVDVIASRLCGLWGFDVPAIYTNVGYGNQIFKSAKMAKYLLVVANWGVSAPSIPKVWKGQDYYIWQYNVVDGKDYGLSSGKIDVDIWGKKLPFPTDEPTPDPEPEPEPSPDTMKVKIAITKEDGITYSADNVTLEKE